MTATPTWAATRQNNRSELFDLRKTLGSPAKELCMKTSGWSTIAAFAVSVTLAGCSGAAPTGFAPVSPMSIRGEQPQMPHGAYADENGSWMLLEAQSEDLLYVANVADVTVYSFPKGKLVGTLSGFDSAAGACGDTHGDIFVTDLGHRQIVEYAHGGKEPEAILQDPGEEPAGCAIDPKTGDLAVASLDSTFGGGDVAIYARAKGKPKPFVDPGITNYYYCGYDDEGNLYVDGQLKGGFQLAEMPEGSNDFTTISLNQHINWPGAVQWDGQYLVVGDKGATVAYRFQVSGSMGMLEGTVDFDGTQSPEQFWIDHRKIIVPNEYFTKSVPHSDVLVYDYPRGGRAVGTISRALEGADGAVVSRIR
jgi:hypothetical protein